VTKGAQFALYPEGTSDYSRHEERLTLVEIDELGATSSWASIVTAFPDAARAVQAGDQAVLLDPGKVRLRRKVRVFRHDAGELPATVDQDSALEAVEAGLETGGLGWIELAAEGETVDYQVAVNEEGEYEIWDRAGEPVPNLRPALQVGDVGAADGAVRRLVHLTKYNNLLLLDNHDRTSPLVRALQVEVLRAQPDFTPGEPPDPQAFDDPGHTPLTKVGDWLLVRIRNQASQDINVAAIDMSPDWGITQVHPTWTEYISLDPGAEEIFPLRAGLPGGYEEGTDVLKVFATLEPANFRWLELPELDQPPVRKAVVTRSWDEVDPLEQMLASFTDDRPKTRDLNPAEYASRGWATAQVEVHIKKA
jgi:hypothetical protein